MEQYAVLPDDIEIEMEVSIYKSYYFLLIYIYKYVLIVDARKCSGDSRYLRKLKSSREKESRGFCKFSCEKV